MLLKDIFRDHVVIRGSNRRLKSRTGLIGSHHECLVRYDYEDESVHVWTTMPIHNVTIYVVVQ